jgi:acyl dehydratase
MTAGRPIGHRYDPFVYPVTREAIDAYVAAVGEDGSAYGEIAPPMFAVVLQAPAVAAGIFDPELGIAFDRLVHGSQEFHWPGPVIRAGDEITTVAVLGEVRETAGLQFFGFHSESRNAAGDVVASGVWTNIVRGEG